MKKTMALLLTTAMFSGLVGCAGGSVASTDNAASSESAAETKTEAATETIEAAESEEGDVTIRFSWWGGDERRDATLAVIEQFEKEHPGVKVEAEYGSSDGYHDKLSAALQAGTAADIIQVDPEVFPQYYATGNDWFVDYKDYDFDLSNFDEAYIGLEINGRYDGKQVGLPTGISGAANLVNKDVADQFGVDLVSDHDWDYLLETGKKLHEENPDYYLLCTNKDYIANLVVFNYGKQLAGGTFVDTASKEVRITEEQLAKTMEYVKSLYDNNVCAPASYQASYSGDDLQNDPNWIDGKYVFAHSYVSTIDVMTAANPSSTYVPGAVEVVGGSTEKGWASNTPQLICVTKASEHPEIAVEFVDYFFNNEDSMTNLKATRSVPSTEKAREICAANGDLTECVAEAANIAAAVGGTPNDGISSSQEFKSAIFDAVEAVSFGSETPEEAAHDLYELLVELTEG